MPKLEWLRDAPEPRDVYIYDGPGFLVTREDGTFEHVDLRGRRVEFDAHGAPYVLGSDGVRYMIPVARTVLTSLD